jgi:hypothetical protein
MGFLTEAARGDDDSDPEEGKEEMYMELFPKIGRDFVHREDLKIILIGLLTELNLQGIIDIENDSGARERAREYLELLNRGEAGSDTYPDLVSTDESPEDG